MNSKLYMAMIFSILLLQGCKMSGTASPKEGAEADVKFWYYKDLLNDRTYRSGSPCVEKWRHSKIVTYNLPNGNFVYVMPTMCGCLMHWEIDRKTEKVLAYTTEGKTCYKLDLVQKPHWYRGKKPKI